MRQKRRHTKLGIAGQGSNHRFQFGIKPVELTDFTQRFFGHFITKRVRDDDDDFLFLTSKFCDLFPVKIHLARKARDCPVHQASNMVLPGIVQFQRKICGIPILDCLIERG